MTTADKIRIIAASDTRTALKQALAVIEIQGAALKKITGPMKGKGCRFVAREALARVAKILAEEK